MNPDATALGIDIGGSRVRAALVSVAGQIIARSDAPLPPDGDPQALHELLAKLAAGVTAQTAGQPSAVGVVMPGICDRRTGVMRRAVNLPWLEGVNVRQLCQEALGGRVLLDTDVNAAGWAQWRHAAPRPARFVYLSLGTGVGGSVILHGRILRHTHGAAGHLGFLIVDTADDAPVDQAGVRGSLSALVCGPVLRAAAERAGGAGGNNTPLPASVLAVAGKALAVACAQLAHLYAPDVIALGGGVVDHHPVIVSAARDAFDRYRSKLTPPEMRIERAPLPTDDAGVIGAALLALDSADRSEHA